MKKQDRNYRLLEYLNVLTRTSYLARIRNPNPKMPDASRIGVASLGHGDEGPEHSKNKHDTRQHDQGVNPEEKP
jgi:molybdopterin-containing oxidoreductase family iron-sulfur binding subunit